MLHVSCLAYSWKALDSLVFPVIAVNTSIRVTTTDIPHDTYYTRWGPQAMHTAHLSIQVEKQEPNCSCGEHLQAG